MINILAGAIIMGYSIAGLYFLKMWRRSREQLFVLFGSAFLLLAINQAIVSVAQISREEHSWVYLIRLAAFLLIIIAILLKNTERGKASGD